MKYLASICKINGCLCGNYVVVDSTIKKLKLCVLPLCLNLGAIFRNTIKLPDTVLYKKLGMSEFVLNQYSDWNHFTKT